VGVDVEASELVGVVVHGDLVDEEVSGSICAEGVRFEDEGVCALVKYAVFHDVCSLANVQCKRFAIEHTSRKRQCLAPVGYNQLVAQHNYFLKRNLTSKLLNQEEE